MSESVATAVPPKTALRHRWSDRGVDRLLWLALPASAFMAVLFFYPAAYGIWLSFHPLPGGGGFLGNYAAFFTQPYLRTTILNTFRIALPAAVINVVLAVPVSLVMRSRGRGQKSLNTFLVVPITLGTVLVARGLYVYLGNRGWLNRALVALGVIDEPIQIIYTNAAVVIALIITGFPFAYLLTSSYLGGINPSLEAAAGTLGASPWRRFTNVTFPLLAPGLAITFCLTFVLAFSVFPSAQMLGNASGDAHVLAIAAANAAFQDYNYPMASTISVITAVIELIVVAAVLGLRTRLYSGSTSSAGKA